MEMKSTENVLNLWVSFDANSVIIAQILYRVKTYCCLVPSRAAGAEWVRVEGGAGCETLCPVAAPPPPHRQLPMVTSLQMGRLDPCHGDKSPCGLGRP